MSQHIVVIGGVALGPKAACRFKRLEPGSTVTMIDQSSLISYGGCGIPYYVSGDVSDAKELCTTSFHMVRSPEFFKEIKGVDVRILTKATHIDRENKEVHVENVTTGETASISYDKLVIATGAAPRKLGLPGEDMQGVSYVCNPDDATRIREGISKGEVGNAVIIGCRFYRSGNGRSLCRHVGRGNERRGNHRPDHAAPRQSGSCHHGPKAHGRKRCELLFR